MTAVNCAAVIGRLAERQVELEKLRGSLLPSSVLMRLGGRLAEAILHRISSLPGAEQILEDLNRDFSKIFRGACWWATN